MLYPYLLTPCLNAFGLPDMDMAGDKWNVDILPVFERSRYKDLLPTRGSGSRGARKVDSVQLKNGAMIKIMTGGGSDKSRSAFTARVVIFTEVDGMDESSATSRETDKITQMEARTRAYGPRKRIYGECTVSTEAGRTWSEYTGGTNTEIVVKCKRCRKWVVPEREHLVGWQKKENIIAARDAAYFVCPNCGATWDRAARIAMNRNAKALHRGQAVKRNRIVGPIPETDTLGFRWNQFNNLFVQPGDIGADEHKAEVATDSENAEKEMRQFVWALPYDPEREESTPLAAKGIVARMAATPKGMVPSDTEYLTVGVDVHRRWLFYTTIAWRPGASGLIVDYGVEECHFELLGEERGIRAALDSLADDLMAGYQTGSGGILRAPDQVWNDSGYATDVVYEFCRERDPAIFRPAKGYGQSQDMGTKRGYLRPKRTGASIRKIGDGYHLAKLAKKRGVLLCEYDADHWKSFLHKRLSTPIAARRGTAFATQ